MYNLYMIRNRNKSCLKNKRIVVFYHIEIQFQMHLFKMTEKRRQAIRSMNIIFSIQCDVVMRNNIFEPEKKLKMHKNVYESYKVNFIL